MNLLLAVKATVDSDKIPELNLRALAPFSKVITALLFIGIALLIYNAGGKLAKSIIFAIAGVLLLGWLDRSGVAVAAGASMGASPEDVYTAMTAAVVVTGLWLVFAGPKGKKKHPLDALRESIPGMSSPRRRRRGR